MKLILSGLFVLLLNLGFGQAISDNCSPIPNSLPVNSACVPVAYNMPGSFTNGGIVNASCATAGNDRDDGWYVFTATATSTSIDLTGDQGHVVSVWSACPSGAATELACAAAASGATATVTFTTVIGVTYYVQVHRRQGANADPMAGNICVYSPTPPPGAPANDDPCSATPLTVNNSCSFATYTNAGATATAGVTAPGCASYSGGDVWFTVTVPASGSITFDSNTGVITDAGMAIYSGTCGALTLIECDDDDSPNGAMSMIALTGQTPGATLWVRFWEYGNNNNGTFDLCAFNPCPTPPANDDPCSATVVPVNATCSYTTYTNACATATAGPPAPGCGGYSGGDVWFQVTVPPSGIMTFNSNTGVMTDGSMAVYSGTCGSLSLVACDDDASTNGLMPYIVLGGQTPGATLWIRFWENGNNNNGTFQLCVYEGGICVTPPTNDDPCSATVIPVNATCSFATYTNECATATAGVPAPGCSSYSGGDVWFQTTVPAAGAMTFDSNFGVITDGGMAIYTGTCSALVLAGCDDDGSANGAMPLIVNNSLVPGSTVWIRFWEYGNNNNGTFDLCVYENTPPPPPPGNVSCGGMEPICSDTPITFTASTGGADADVVNPGNNYGCLFSSPNPTWYYLELLTGGTVAINMTAGSDIDFALWGPFANLAAAQTGCNSYGAPTDCSYSTSATEQANYTGAVAGQVFVLLVTNYADVTQVIDLNSAGTNTALTDCSIILPIDLLNFYATPIYGANKLFWTTKSELSNASFIVERSYNGTNFTSIGEINGAGNSATEINYEYLDREFQNEIIYYRLKQIDFNGEFKYSKILTINRDIEAITIYPNPTNNSISFSFPTEQKGNIEIVYKDALGKEFKESMEIEDGIKSFTSSVFETLPSGVYFVEIRQLDGCLLSIQKVIKNK